MSWQGKSGSVPGGTTILSALRHALGEGIVTSSADGSGAKGADLGVVVVGETPYAEFMGDREAPHLDSSDIEAIRNVKKEGVPVVVVLISGRPLYLEPILQDADAVVAAWLPGTEGDGVADVLLGRAPFTGKLPLRWPRIDRKSVV